MVPTTFGHGYLPDPYGHRYLKFHLHTANEFRGPLPKEVQLVTPPIWDQSVTSSCVGHGTAGCLTTTLIAHGKLRADDPPINPSLIYRLARAVDRDSPHFVLRDEGAMPNQCVRAMAHWGVASSADIDGGRLATSPDYAEYLVAHINDEPKLGELIKAKKNLITGVNALIAASPTAQIEGLCKALASRYAVMMAVAAGNAQFQSFKGGEDNVLTLCGTEFDHWVYLSGYRTRLATGKREFKLVNSWGLGPWTEDGTAWIDEDFAGYGLERILIANLGL